MPTTLDSSAAFVPIGGVVLCPTIRVRVTVGGGGAADGRLLVTLSDLSTGGKLTVTLRLNSERYYFSAVRLLQHLVLHVGPIF